jgi:hypothetical protein
MVANRSVPDTKQLNRLADDIVPTLMHERDRLTVTLFDRYQVTPHFGLHAVSFTINCKFDP